MSLSCVSGPCLLRESCDWPTGWPVDVRTASRHTTQQRKGDKNSGSGSSGNAGSGSSRPRGTRRPRNETGSAGSSSAASDAADTGFFFEENEALAAKHAAMPQPPLGETEVERAQRLQEEEEWMLDMSRDDPEGHTVGGCVCVGVKAGF